MTPRSPLYDALPLEQFIAWRKEGLSYAEIGRRIGFGARAVGKHAKRVLPESLQFAGAISLERRLPVAEFIAWREDEQAYTTIAARLGVGTQTLRKYGRRVLPERLQDLQGHAGRVADLLPVEQFIAWRERDKLTFEQIGEKIGFTTGPVAAYGRKVLPRRLQKAAHNLKRDLSLEQIIEWRGPGFGWSWVRIAEETHFSPANIAAYARQTLEPVQYRRWTGADAKRQAAKKSGRCKRCEMPDEPANPLDDEGFCLWCRLEAAGENLRQMHLAGRLPLLNIPDDNPELETEAEQWDAQWNIQVEAVPVAVSW